MEEQEALKDIHIFRPGRIPPYRQMFYQYKDLYLDAAQEVIQANYEGVKCDEKHGWYKPGTDDKLRNILTASINEVLANEGENSQRENEDEEDEEDDSDSSETDED